MRKFFNNANKSFRAAGMREMQMAVRADGTIDTAPSRPKTVQVVNDGGSATILWRRATDDHKVSRYRIYRDGELIATMRNTTWYTDPAGNDGSHTYEVRAVDDSGLEGDARVAGGAADQATQGAGGAKSGNGAATGPTKLSTPKIAKVAEVQPGVMGLAWGAVKGAVAYGIYQNGKLVGHVTNPVFAAAIKGSVGLQVDAVAADGSRSARTAVKLLKPTGVAATATAATTDGTAPAADQMTQASSTASSSSASTTASTSSTSTGASPSASSSTATTSSTTPAAAPQNPPAGYNQMAARR